MGKNKLRKFAEMKTFDNVFQSASYEMSDADPVLQMRGKWNEFFGNNNPIVLELGCGHGDYTVGLAACYPNKNFIGIDIKGARLWAGAKSALEQGLQNVAFLRTSIEFLPRFFAQNEISEIWITFPDPQMKKATKRLTSTFFMQRYQTFTCPNALVHLKTDSPFLYTYTVQMLKDNDYTVLINTDDLYKAEEERIIDAQRLQTYYERQWLDRGLTIKYLRWQLEKKEHFTEPTIEIEKDSYRSYGRNYQNPTQQ